MQEKIEETDNLIYDDRRKIMIQKKSQTTENWTEEPKEDGEMLRDKLVSKVKQSMEVEYTQEGIKLAYSNLIDEKKFHEKQIVKIKENLKDAGEMTDDLIELKEKLEKIAKIEQSNKQKKDLGDYEERLKVVNKEINQIKETIGSRLQL